MVELKGSFQFYKADMFTQLSNTGAWVTTRDITRLVSNSDVAYYPSGHEQLVKPQLLWFASFLLRFIILVVSWSLLLGEAKF